MSHYTVVYNTGEYNTDETVVDATRFVRSGEYYFDCQLMLLVSRHPKQFPVENARRAGKIGITQGSYPEYEPFLMKELTRPEFFNDLIYQYTIISEDESPAVLYDSYYKIIQHDMKHLFIDVDADVRGGFTASIDVIEPGSGLARSYEEIREQAKNSCSHPQ